MRLSAFLVLCVMSPSPLALTAPTAVVGNLDEIVTQLERIESSLGDIKARLMLPVNGPLELSTGGHKVLRVFQMLQSLRDHHETPLPLPTL